MKKGAVRRLLRFGKWAALFAGDFGWTLDRIAQERRHVIGKARAATFWLALARTLRPLLTLTARLRRRLGVGVPVTRLLALAAVRRMRRRLRVLRSCRALLLALLVTGLLAVFRTLLASRLALLSALLRTCLWPRLWPRLTPLAATLPTTTTALALARFVVAARLRGSTATAATAPTLRSDPAAATATLLSG